MRDWVSKNLHLIFWSICVVLVVMQVIPRIAPYVMD